MRAFLFLLACLLAGDLAFSPVKAQTAAPLSAPEVLLLMGAEAPEAMSRTTVGEIEIIEQGPETAVAAAPMWFEPHTRGDVVLPAEKIGSYVYFVRENGRWRLKAIKPGMDVQMRATARAARRMKADAGRGATLPEIQADAERYLLAISSDQHIIEHFRKNLERFEAVRSRITAMSKVSSGEVLWIWRGPHELDSLLGSLELRRAVPSVERAQKPSSGSAIQKECRGFDCFTLVLDERTFDAPPLNYMVGFFHVDRPEHVPRMAPDGYIVIRPLGGGWHFFRRN